MGVLDTFFILFKTDADKAADDVLKLDKATDKVEGGLRRADLAAASLGRSFVGMAVSLAAPIVALVSAGSAISAVYNRIEEIGNIGDASLKLRSSAADYDAFTRAVRAAGGDLGVAQENLSKFSDKLNDAAARPDGPNAKNFKKWGIAFKDVKGEAVGAVEGLVALSKSLEGVSQAEALGRLRRLGIEDADTIEFLLKGKTAILEKMDAEKRAGVVTDAQIELEGQYQAAVGKTRNVLDSIAGAITEAVLPAMIKAYDAFTAMASWVLNNSRLVQGFFIGLAAVVTYYFLPAMASAAAAVIAATWPFLAIGAAIAAVGAAFALAYEDVRAFLDGQPSLIGALAERYEWFGAIIEGIGEVYKIIAGVAQEALGVIADGWDLLVRATKAYLQALTDFWGQFKPIFDALGEYFSAVGELVKAMVDRVTGDLGALVNGWRDRFNELTPIVREVFEGMLASIGVSVGDITGFATVIQDAFVGAFNYIKSVWDSTIGGIAAGISGLAQSLRNLAGGVAEGGEAPPATGGAAAGARMGAMIRPAQAALGNASSTAVPVAGGGATNVNNTSTVNTGPISIQTQATDAKAIAGALDASLKEKLRATSSNFDDGVDR